MVRKALAASLLSAAAATCLAAQGISTGGTLLVTVLDRTNQPTVDVDAMDFVVSQGGQAREVIAVRVADYPLVLLLDDSAEAAESLPAIRTAARRFVERVGDRAIAVLSFSDPPAVVASFEDDRATVLTRLAGVSPASTAVRAPLQALGAAADLISATGTSFSAIVLISGAPLEDDQVEPPGFVTSFLSSRAILHVVTKGVSLPTRAGGEGILRNLANRSGGRHQMIYATESFQAALDQLADLLGTELMVEYLVPPGAADDREVQVGVKVPGARVRGMGVAR